MSSPPVEGEPPREEGDEPFEGVPPEDLEAEGEPPELEPQFQDALREVAGEPPPQAAEEPPPTEEQPAEPPPPQESPEQGEDQPTAGETVEYAPGDAPDAEEPDESGGAPEEAVEEDGDGAPEDGDEAPEDGDGDKPVRTVVIGAGSEPEAPSEPQTPAKPVPAVAPATATPAAPTAPPPAPGLPTRPPPEGDPEPAPRRPRLWLRFLSGSFVIVASVAAAVSSSILLEVSDIAQALRPIPKVERLLRQVDPGEPQNILVLGSDKRASEPGTKGLSDTTILLRLDPHNDAIAIMNIPRDLKTYIPGVGTDKFNAAYAYGGPKLTLKVVKRITGGLPIHHVVNVDFLGFIRAINALDCVYVDVDRRYYNSNVGVPPELQYAEINIRPGYQKLCGTDALEYVRYRHTDTDLVRAARQQDFLREARQRVPVSKLVLPSDRDELINIFTKYTSSDIDSLRAMLDVLDLLIASRSAPIREVRFPAILHPSFVTADKGAVAAAVAKYEGIEASGGPRGALESSASGQTGILPEERKRAQAKKGGGKPPPQKKLSVAPSTNNDGLVDASQGSRDVAASAAKRVGRSFPIFYPRRLPSGAIYVENPRVYHVRDTDKKARGAYRMVLQLPQGDYFGVQGVRGWTDPPILADPSETVTIRGRDFDIFIDGDRVRLISWEDKGNSYWISNSLLQTLTNDQMLGLARSIHKIPGERGPKKKRR
ncbi:MAG: LCP family protein [Actinomycetota bacterium]